MDRRGEEEEEVQAVVEVGRQWRMWRSTKNIRKPISAGLFLADMDLFCIMEWATLGGLWMGPCLCCCYS